jgi:perosamine synthetase
MFIPHSKPFIGKAETIAVNRVVASGQLSEGTEVASLEQELSSLVGQRYGVTVSSGTAALYLALRSLGIGRGDSVVIPSYVCTALLNAVNMTGASPSITDVQPDTGEMTTDLARKAMRKNTKAAIVPHLFGIPADANSIESGLGVPVIEDCAQCVGTSFGGKKAGGQTRISVFSFYATKLIAAGEGGMVATSDRRIADRIIDMREYDHRVGYVPAFNFKLSDVHASIARQQLRKLPEMIKRRREIARLYDDSFASLPSLFRYDKNESIRKSVYYRYVVHTAGNVQAIIKKMDSKGVACRRPIYKPLHRYLKKNGFTGTEVIYKRAISIPIYPGLTRIQVDYICKSIINAFK